MEKSGDTAEFGLWMILVISWLIIKFIKFNMSATNAAIASFEKGIMALRLYRRVMKLHIRNMPQDLRLFGMHETL